jgi:sigma-B regulation protein RsbU (phosphoserine phosphatase)
MRHLVITDSGGRRTEALRTSPFSIGRGSDNHLPLIDPQVSRRHAELLSESGGSVRVRDLGSRLGTIVNGERVTERYVGPGDTITIGSTRIQVADEESAASGVQDFRQLNALLAGLRALGSAKVLDEVLAIVIDGALDLTQAERGFILLADSSGRLTLRLARGQGGTALTSAHTSQRIPDEVFATGTDRIVMDLADDLNVSQHAGTIALGIRHVLCTPLKVVDYATGREHRIGVLYLDSQERGYLRTASGLHGLAAEAAVVIENARLTEEVIRKERVAQEMRIAVEMQQALLPPSHALLDSAELAAVTTPCREVGGDLFEYYPHEDGSVSFAVADVSGKGTSAALVTAVVQGLLAGEAETTDPPGSILTRMNRALCRRRVGARFVTVFFGHLTPDGRLRYCNAGHNPPVLVRPDGVARLEDGGTVLGLFEHGQYATGETRLAAGDLVVVFSDGVTEMSNAQDEEYGDERLVAAVRAARTNPVREIVDTVTRSLASFAGGVPSRDDVTILAIRRR